MSQIKLSGNPSGTGTLTIASPNTNSDYTFSLPASSGTVATLASVTNNGVVYVNSSGQPTSGSGMVFDGSNLGLGVTPSAWSARALQVNARATLFAFSNDAHLGYNAYYGDTYRYIASDFATDYMQTSGQHRWFVAPSGTAGNAISFTQAMTLDSNGNLLVGRSSSAGNARVCIAGNSDSTTGINLSYQTVGEACIRVVSSNALTFGYDISNGNTERMRITSAGNVGINTTNPTAKLHVAGSINYDNASTNGVGGLNVSGIYTYNNNSANSIGGGANNGFILVTISQGNGVTTIPIFANAGGGIAWYVNVLDPDAGTFSSGSGATVNFATAGTGANSYQLVVNSGTAAMTLQRTAGSAAYTVSVQFISG